MNCEVYFTLSEGCGTHELYFKTDLEQSMYLHLVKFKCHASTKNGYDSHGYDYDTASTKNIHLGVLTIGQYLYYCHFFIHRK